MGATIADGEALGLVTDGFAPIVIGEPLTASFDGAPSEHDGEGAFSFGLTFSEEVKLSFRTLKESALVVENGRVTKATRAVKGENRRWTVTVKPDSLEDVVVTLPATTDCGASGAVCTHAGKPLSNAARARVPGPALLSVADAEADEGGILSFAVRLSRAAGDAVTVDYATADGTAEAGEDYAAAAGTLTFAAGETSKTVEVQAHADRAAESDETFTLALSNASGAAIDDGEATGAVADVPPPAVSNVAVASDAGEDDTYRAGDTIRVRVTFSEAVDVTGSPRLKIKMDPDYGEKWALYESGSGTAELTFAYTVAEPNESAQGVAVLANTLELNGGTIESASSRMDAALAHDGLDHDPAHKVDATPDTTAPALAAATVDGRTLTLTFDEPLAAVDTGALTFAFVVDGIMANGSISPGRIVIDGATVTLHLGIGAAPGQTVTVTYFADAAGNALRDAAGNPVAGFDNAAVENAPPPAAATASAVRVSSAPEEGDTYGPGETIRVTVTFGEAVAVDAPGAPRLKIDLDPAHWGVKWANYESGSGTTELTFAYTVAEPNESTQGIAVLANSLELNGGTIWSASSGTDADLAHDGLDHDPEHKVDWEG